jgi:hypothetical protein
MTTDSLDHSAPTVVRESEQALLFCDSCDATEPVDTGDPGWQVVLHEFVSRHVRLHGMVHVGFVLDEPQ